jgi:hypothetical protein
MNQFNNNIFIYGGGDSYGDGQYDCTGDGCSDQWSYLADRACGSGSGSDYSSGDIKLKGYGAGTSYFSGISNCSGYSDDYLIMTDI